MARTATIFLAATTALALRSLRWSPSRRASCIRRNRNSPTVVGTISGVDARIDVATFDAAEDKDYNRKNCEMARDLFANQSLLTVRYWCERGKFTQ